VPLPSPLWHKSHTNIQNILAFEKMDRLTRSDAIYYSKPPRKAPHMKNIMDLIARIMKYKTLVSWLIELIKLIRDFVSKNPPPKPVEKTTEKPQIDDIKP